MDVGNYTLSDLLGRGGTSEVYAAKHRFLGDEVAIKLLRRSLADDGKMRDAFLEEAARTREIQHPNVVRVVDFGHDEASGSCYLVMERIAGDSLATRLRARGRLTEPELRRFAAAIADGMAAAHARGIVHRDLKPGNVMLRGDEPTIVDFGIAKSLGATSAVITERRVGTIAYMAPEQLTDGLITPAVDVWALGVVMFEAATGKLPFGNFADGRLPQLFDVAPRAATLAAISPALDALIARCLEKDPGKRPARMADIARVLRGEDVAGYEERITEDVAGRAHASAASHVSASPAAPVPPRKRWPVVVIASAALTIAVTVTVVLASSSQPARQPPPGETPPVVLPAEPVAIPDAAVEHAEAPAPAKPHVKPRPPRSDKPRTGKPRTTSQGETLD